MNLNGVMRTIGVVVVATCILPGCATIVNPRLDLPNFGVPVGNNTVGSYDNARAIAVTVESNLNSRITDLDKFDFWSSVGIFATGLATTAGGIYGAHRDFIVGGALVGASILGSRTLIPLSARRGIFSQGQAAIECGMAATDFQAPPSSDGANQGSPQASTLASVRPALSGVLSASADLQPALAKVQVDLVSTGRLSAVNALAGVKAAELAAAVQRTNDAVNAVGMAADNAYAQRPKRLESMVRTVVLAVNAQLESNSLDPTAALQAAQQSVTSLVKSYQDAAKQALDAVTQQQQKAQETANVAKLAATAASDPAQKPAQDAANQLQTTAQNAQDLATQIKPILNQIISTAGLSATCFGGLMISQ